MSSLLHKLGLWCSTHAKRVLLGWAILLAGLSIGFATVGMQLSSEYTIRGTESMEGLSVLTERLPQASGASEQVLFTSTQGNIYDYQSDINEFVTSVEKISGVSLASDPFSEKTKAISDDATHAMVQIQTDSSVGTSTGAAGPEATRVSKEINAIISSTHHDGLTIQRSGNIGQSISISLSSTELIGVLVAAFVLFLTFGSALTAGVPIISAFIGVGVGMLSILVLAATIDINSTTPVLAVMIGLAVGIDYALFIISRAREYLSAGTEPREAAARAVATAGSAVVFAGGTVIIALCGLMVAGIPFLTTMGFASAGVVAVAVAVAITAVPAFLGLLGKRATPKAKKQPVHPASQVQHSPISDPSDLSSSPSHEENNLTGQTSAHESQRNSPEKEKIPFSRRWVRAITHHRLLTIFAVVILLGLTAIPIGKMRLALTDNGYEPKGTELRETYDAISQAYGPGYNSPIIVIADIVQTSDPIGVVNSLSEELSALPGVKRIALATPNEDGSFAFIQIIPEKGQADPSTTSLVKEIRARASSLESTYGISKVMVTGYTAVAIDIANQLNAALLPFGIVVVGLSLIILMVVFRSIAVPLTATLGYLLSLAAGMGAVGAVYGYGWLADFLNVSKTGAVISFLPVIVMGILFGLAMDYQVFLVSRMLEEWTRTHDAKHSVEAGFVGSAKVVTAAAIIMTAVFAAFIPEGMVQIKPIAIALTVGIAADAFLVRMTLIPAIMALLGEKAWWIPRWLDRLLPVVDVEGNGLARSLEHNEWTQRNGQADIRIEHLHVSDGKDILINDVNLIVRPGGIGLALSDEPAARRALTEIIVGNLRPTGGLVSIVNNVLPDGTSLVQGATAILHNWDGLIGKNARIVLVDNPGQRRWSRIRELIAQGRTVVVTGPSSLPVPDDIRSQLTTISQVSLTSTPSSVPAQASAPSQTLVTQGSSVTSSQSASTTTEN